MAWNGMMRRPTFVLFIAGTSIVALLVKPVPGLAQSGSFRNEWRQLLGNAQAEGQIGAFACCGMGRSIGKVIGEFERKYKIKVVFSSGSSRQQADRVLLEHKAGKYLLDLWIGGITTANTRLIPAQTVEPVRPLLVHPEVLDDAAWFGEDGPVFMDPLQEYIVAFVGNGGMTSEINYNTNLVNVNEINSYWDLLKPKWKGKIVARDPTTAEVAQVTGYFYMHPQLGPTFLRRLLTEMDITVVSNARQAAEWLALGKYAFCLFACQREVRKLAEQGLPVRDEISKVLKEVPRIHVGGGAIWTMNHAPHPNARKFFINWWLSREGQELMQRADGDDSLRLDIPKGAVRPSDLRQPGVAYWFPDREPNFEQRLAQGMNFARQLMTSARK